jgi:uncharacterized protein YodC (DUF2158 family)
MHHLELQVQSAGVVVLRSSFHIPWREIQMAKFKVGETVRLKSGGPLMTVSIAEHDDDTWCMWFDKTGKREETTFNAAVLVADDGGPVIG